jgi:hypothetical protein
VPHANYKTVVRAPFERVSALLIDKQDKPKKYIGAILWSKITERGEGYIVREMLHSKPKPMLVREKIHHHPIPGGEEYIYEHVANERYTGQFRNILTRIDGRGDECVLEYRMEWTPHPAMPEEINQATANSMVRSATNQMKELAENPVAVPDWVREWYAAVDSLNAEALDPWLADDVVFRFGNGNDVMGRAAVTELNREVFSHKRSMQHDFVEVYEDKGRTLVEAFVNYELPSADIFLLPMLTTMERRDGKISRIRIYGDVSPLQHGWPEAR